jgi:hypothetical protein
MGGVGISAGALRQPWLADQSRFVMAGLDPAIHVFVVNGVKNVDARDKPGHDDELRLARRGAYAAAALPFGCTSAV